MIRPLCNLTVKRLEHIFHVPGLPLVAKSDPERHTTSILVRGGPGTGKTTLALALGQAIAADGGGALVYLTTEFSPAEIRFKAELLRFDEQDVKIWSWDGVTRTAAIDAPAGTVFVHHVSPPEPSDELEAEETEVTSGSKKQFILESAWRLLGEGGEPPHVAGLPVRALVIDAFILPDYGGDDAEVRTDLVAFIQALETLGVTPVLVEEVAPESPSWFPFIVDLVFHLAHTRSAEGEWMRTMSCTKSRYGLVSAGPHTYSLKDGTPALFPTMRHTARGMAKVSPLLRFAFLAERDQGLWHIVEGHQVILSPFEGGNLFNSIGDMPGATKVTVRLGFPCTITGPVSSGTVDESEGPAVLAWSILDVVIACQANVVDLHGISRVLRHEAWRRPIEQMLDALRHLGLVVVVIDDFAAIRPLAPLADISVRPGTTQSAEPGAVSGQLQLRLPRLGRFSPPLFIHGLASILDDVGKASPEFPGQFDEPDDGSALASWTPELPTSPRWNLICAWVAGNLAAMDALERTILDEYPRYARLAARLVRARTIWQGVEVAEQCAARLVEHSPRAAEFPWLLERTKAELRLDHKDRWREGISMLRELLARGDLPRIHAAEISYNIAFAFHMNGEHGEALEAAKQALEHNPRLFPAERLIESYHP